MRDSLENPANKLEGGFCMDNLQAVAEEMARMDAMEVQPIPDHVLLDTAEGEYLDRKALDYNETRNPAAASVGNLLFTGEAGTAIPLGTEVLYGTLVFETTAAAQINAEGYCEVGAKCQTAGTVGNVAIGTIPALRRLREMTPSAAECWRRSGGPSPVGTGTTLSIGRNRCPA